MSGRVRIDGIVSRKLTRSRRARTLGYSIAVASVDEERGQVVNCWAWLGSSRRRKHLPPNKHGYYKRQTSVSVFEEKTNESQRQVRTNDDATMEDSGMLAWCEREELDARLDMTGTRPRTGPPLPATGVRVRCRPAIIATLGSAALPSSAADTRPDTSVHGPGLVRRHSASLALPQCPLPGLSSLPRGFLTRPWTSRGHNGTVYGDTSTHPPYSHLYETLVVLGQAGCP